MDLKEALDKAGRVFAEEQVQPTLAYIYQSDKLPSHQWAKQFDPSFKGWTASMIAFNGLLEERRVRPRYVYEDPKLFAFVSTNFDLLIKIFSQVSEGDRPAFISALLRWVRKPIAALHAKGTPAFPSFRGQQSLLGLLAEFCIRTGHQRKLLAATAEPILPTASLAIMLKQIEEMIALNFNLFSDNDLVSIPSDLSQLYKIAERQTYSARGPRNGPKVQNPHFMQGYTEIGNEIVESIKGITEECRKARYFYLKGALQELPNLEIESDKLRVEGFLVKLGFSITMVQALNAAESDYKSTATAFELKNCLGHLRSFLEHLHRESAKSISTAMSQPLTRDRWGDATLFLRQQGYISEQHEKFVASLYTLLSDESVHPLTTDREYARLLRNVVIEYGVMFLSVLEKRGVKI